ncbi:aldo-keto reductase [Microstroma glucosiphilum]|uniref:Aldo-keto reductase n=1 Tax=Pseudomicrostroma glucosiphilum TaxID=1684307 RepID=A0A316TYZ9_9BASI|nr:aldo-keto reductase [Pseudomicrostroma glucosiphilum]PWN18469.1 aldo-keto reductase [Pseudomicrostroma glucosiphilum]
MTTTQFPAPGAANAVSISPIGFGAMGFHAFYRSGAPEQAEFEAFMNELLKEIPNPVHIDTAAIYGLSPDGRESETAIGKWLAKSGQRKNVFLATKFGFDKNFAPAATAKDAHASLARSLELLQTDYVDLFYIHRPDRALGIEDTMKGLKELKESGKIRHIGVSEFNQDELVRAHKIVPISAVQIEVSPWTPEPLYNGTLEWCKKEGVALVPYSPLGRGFLAGKFKSEDDIADDDFRKGNERFQGENFKKNLELVDDIKKIAAKRSATPGQICLAWLLAQGPNVFPIPGTTKAQNMKENAAASKIKLTKEEEEEITGIIKSFKASGERYPEMMRAALAF